MSLNMEVPLPSARFKSIGINILLLTPAKRFDLTRTEGPMRVLFGLLPTSAKDTGHDLADFLKSVQLFDGVGAGDLLRLARLVHERSYRDGEYMFEQGNPAPPCLSSAPAPSSSSEAKPEQRSSFGYPRATSIIGCIRTAHSGCRSLVFREGSWPTVGRRLRAF